MARGITVNGIVSIHTRCSPTHPKQQMAANISRLVIITGANLSPICLLSSKGVQIKASADRITAGRFGIIHARFHG